MDEPSSGKLENISTSWFYCVGFWLSVKFSVTVRLFGVDGIAPHTGFVWWRWPAWWSSTHSVAGQSTTRSRAQPGLLAISQGNCQSLILSTLSTFNGVLIIELPVSPTLSCCWLAHIVMTYSFIFWTLSSEWLKILVENLEQFCVLAVSLCLRY